MFKIPKWEEDVPKTNIAFGRALKKKKNKKDSENENNIQKSVIQHNSNVFTKKDKNTNLFTVKNTQNQSSNKKNVNINKNHSQANNKLNGSNKPDEVLVNLGKRKLHEPVTNQEDLQAPVSKKKKKKNKNKQNLEDTDNVAKTKNVMKLNESENGTEIETTKKKFNEKFDNKSKSKFMKPKTNTKFESIIKDTVTKLNENNLEHKKSKNRKKRNKSNSDNNSEYKTESTTKVKSDNDDDNSNISNNFLGNNKTFNGIKRNAKKEKLKKILAMNNNRNDIDVTKKGNNLRQRMLEKLKAAQFRYLNEKLYTSSGTEAKQLFQSDPEAFQTYHQGYQLQVKKWPVNPLDIIVKRISQMPKIYTIADMGCGEAALSRRVPHSVRSFDLVAAAPAVEVCDMAHTPLLTGSTDVAVYCLALMGTDLTRYLLEANRVLKMGGHLLIAEVESRFDNVEDFTSEVQRLGFQLKKLDNSHKVFFFMEFTKIREPPVKKSKLPTMSLKPCLYKRR
ncbi:ribosomal RNA-processing protein 8 [Achroia grisella]|uniref:ribosomal RNA-processing protein 8 n=1 Tax=Achroia grisella TaxID=688607 RepID=UPI0027D3475E|nr:ribosomal RNA-processing protein 8 [Achroia grisella]